MRNVLTPKTNKYRLVVQITRERIRGSGKVREKGVAEHKFGNSFVIGYYMGKGKET